MHRQGFNGTAVQDITDAARLPKGSFYNYFESKEALALEVIDRYAKQDAERASVLSDESISPVDRLRRYFASLAANLAEQNYERGCLMGNFSTELADQSRLIRDRLSSNFAAWSRRIATNVALDHLRRSRREVELPEEMAASARPDPAMGRELRQQIRAAFEQLPPKYRLVAVLALVEEEPYENIAAAAGIS